MFNNSNYNYPNYAIGYPYGQNYNVSQPQVQQSNGINWVQGEAGAKSYNIAAGQSVLLMDSESNVFYIKSSDISGMPLPLRIFDYTERKQKQESPQQNNDYITRKEFEKRLSELKNNAKQSVQST